MPTLHRLLLRSRRRISDPENFLSSLTEKFARTLDLDTLPQVSKLLHYLKCKQFALAVKVADEIAEQQYGDPWSHFSMNQLASLVRKVPYKDRGLRPERLAMEIFHKAEHRCKRTNQHFRAMRRVGIEKYSDFKHYMRKYITSVIGTEPCHSSIAELCGFGPGASVGVHGRATHSAAKLSADAWTVTSSALPIATAYLKGDFHLREYLVSAPSGYTSMDDSLFEEALLRKVALVTANKITMVPKNAKVHRTIAIEPLLNGYIQKGVDEYMRTCLAKKGIDLSDQKKNQDLARLGSLGFDNPFCTIDLSAASDSLAIEVVRDLLPPDWFNFLNRIRSPEFQIGDTRTRYEKFTSMGNGFCFPLQTLIFASVVYAAYAITGDTEFRVYGDDIIVRQRSALLVIELLKHLGFRTNTDKTFIFGPFRESCGADFFEGVPVRPYTIDKLPKTDNDLYAIYNGLRNNSFMACLSVCQWVLDHIPFRERLLRPIDGNPDTAATVPLDVFMGSRFAKWCRGLQSWTWKELLSQGKRDPTKFHPSVMMYGVLRGAISYGNTPDYTFRRLARHSIRSYPSTPLS